jgi:ABC-2 type transport system ATP-binding protein
MKTVNRDGVEEEHEDATIVLDDVTKLYRTGGGVKEVSLSIGPGEVFGFLGPNGAGKTTVIRLLLDLIRPNAGSIRIFGLDSRADSVAIRRRVGYVPGELALYDRFTARQILTHFAFLRGGMEWSAITKPAQLLDLELDQRLRSMSKGNRQKLALVAALMGDPELLVLDEPTSGLDPLVQQQVHAEVRRAAEEGRTVFLSSHVLSEVGEVADRVGLIREGRLIAVERVSELQQRSIHQVDATFSSLEDEASFASLPGVSACRLSDRTLHLEVSGSLRPIIARLANTELLDLSIREPTLEELFLSFYEQPHG